jgi:hypothetical protein
MSTQKGHFFPRGKFERLWLALIVAPPGIYFIYMVLRSILSYDGRLHGPLGSGAECTLFKFILSELTSPFFLPFMVLMALFWMAAIGVIYFGVKILKRISKGKETSP